jgi:hypothetical protein
MARGWLSVDQAVRFWPRHSSYEAGEQSGTARCGAICGGANCSGAGGAKGGSQLGFAMLYDFGVRVTYRVTIFLA